VALIHSIRTETDPVTKRVKDPINVRLYLPEQFTFAIGTSYQQPFAQSMVKQTLTNFAAMVGMTNFVTQAMTLQVWQGTTEVQFSLSFELHAKTDAEKDVIQPIKDLLYLNLPGRTQSFGGFLTPPGPSLTVDKPSGLSLEALSQAVKYKNEISLQIGHFMRFDSVVIEQVNHVFDTQFDKKGLPTSAQVDVQFKTFVVPVRDDLNRMFLGGKSVQGGRGNASGAGVR
jgi:hypothetical protein